MDILFNLQYQVVMTYQKILLEDVTDNFNSKRIPLSAKERSKIEKIYPYYGAQGIIDHVDNYLFDGEFILIAEDGENLKSQRNQVCNLVSGKFWVNNHAHIVQANGRNSTKYLYYLLNQIDFRRFVSGSAQPKLTKDNLNRIELFIHKPEAQRRIASVLSALDEKIALNQRINAELEAMAKKLYDYWFVQFDFPDAEGRPYKSAGGKMVYSEKLKREIPEGWGVGSANDVLEINPSLSLSTGKSAAYVDMNSLPTEGYMTSQIQQKEFKGGVKFQNGDVVIARITPCLENGKTGLITQLQQNDQIGFGSTEFIVLRGKDFPISSFTACLSRSEYFRKYAIMNMTGTSGRKRVDAKDIALFPMVIPEKKILEKFENLVSPFFKNATANTIQSQHLTQLRDWLLPMLMNGQVAVGA